MALGELIEAEKARAGGGAASPQPSAKASEEGKSTPPKKANRPGQRARRSAGKRAEAASNASGSP
eukprot:13203002-Alexandrium_andersonii.AAC.1